jgi:very-short-patch-repair endonuclease
VKKLTLSEFINKANNIHNNKYDYSLSNYITSKSMIDIICPIHGLFSQRTCNHLRGDGCPSCSGNKKLNTIEFINRAKKIHGNKYDYSLVDYKGIDNKVKIICKIHGTFEQTPNKHIGKTERGCPKCNGGVKLDTITFIENAKKIHGDKYNYSLVDYKNTNINIKIICPIHGIFEQRPRHHIYGCGCPKCSESNGEKEIIKFLKNDNFIKQKKFKDCRYIKILSFDFYLPEKNLCIEYDGEQHYKSIKYFGGDDAFIKTQTRDKIKTNFCIKNNINLLRIKYNENIENKLKEYGLGL